MAEYVSELRSIYGTDTKTENGWPSGIHNNEWLNRISEACKKYSEDDSYVYKTCHNVPNTSHIFGLKREWMVILKKVKSTITNEDRHVVDSKYAHYRANKLKVVEIFNINNPNIKKKSVTNVMVILDKKCTYDVGSVVKADNYDYDICERYAEGIYYFKTYHAAFYYGAIPNNYTGNVLSTDETGFPLSIFRYSEGKCFEHIRGKDLVKVRYFYKD